MAITVRKGNWADFDPYKMRPAEFSIILDREQLYYCTSPGNVRRVATKEEIIEILETNQDAYNGLQQLLTELEDETVATGILADISQLLDDVAINKIHIADNRTDIDTNTQDVADLDTRVSSHLAEKVTQVGGAHGFIYEEGSWTPRLNLFTGTYREQVGKYIRKGNEVTVYAKLAVTTPSFSSQTQVVVQGLPFNTNQLFPTSFVPYITPKTTTNIPVGVTLTDGNYSAFWFYKLDSTSQASFSSNEIVNGTQLQFTATYRIN